MDEWMSKIDDDPCNKNIYQSELSDYIAKCMPYIQQYMTEDTNIEVSTDNAFNCKVTTGLQKKDIYTDYLIDVEKKSLPRVTERVVTDICHNCPGSNVVYYHDTSDLVCDSCGMIIDVLISQELTYREEQETSEKVINYSYKRDNHFNEWLSHVSSTRDDYNSTRGYLIS